MTNDFYSYKILIGQYTNNEIIEEYFNKLKQDEEIIKAQTIKWISDFSKEYEHSLNIF